MANAVAADNPFGVVSGTDAPPTGNFGQAEQIAMTATNRLWKRVFVTASLCTLLGAAAVLTEPWSHVFASGRSLRNRCNDSCATCSEEPFGPEVGGAWYWLRSPDQEKRVVMGLFNRYCIRCHGVDGRGVWDIPDVPNFTNPRWQASRTDGQIARIIMEGRGAVMPPFRGAINLEEAWAIARYLRTFPGQEASRPDLEKPAKPETPAVKPN